MTAITERPNAISADLVEQLACDLNRKAAMAIPADVMNRFDQLIALETEPLSLLVLEQIKANAELAIESGRPMCGDTGLPRYYVKIGNEAPPIAGGMVAFETALRRAVARVTKTMPLRPNRVHPLTRADHDNNVGMHAPDITYTYEPDSDWIDIITVHKGGLFGSDYRMLFPSDGIKGIKRFFLDVVAEFNRRGLACPPSVVGIGLGGTKDVCFRLGKEAACLRYVPDRNPDPQVAALEEELAELGNKAGFGPMGFPGATAIAAVKIECAYAHTGGMPMSVHHFCHATRRAIIRIHPDGSTQYREDPQWFTPYYRRVSVEW
jgi:L(+)-tartrate dehydratase alpha subunit